MASHPGQSSATLPISFFKIIIETNVEKIKLPNKFIRIYGGGLPNPVSLRTPDFKKWVVYWTKKDGGVWFVKGWKEFVKNYSLGYGSLVVFNYKGTSQIDILIHDTNAVEINYLSSGNGSVNTENVNTEKVNTENVSTENVNTENVITAVIVTEKEQNASPMPLRVCSPPRKEPLTWKVGRHNDKGTNVRALIRHQGESSTQSGKCLNMPRTQKGQKITERFKSEHTYFTIMIEKSKLAEDATKCVPKFLDCSSGEKNVILQMGHRTWCVRLICSRHRYHRFSSGWPTFAKEIGLVNGDVCIFELINPAVPLLRVHVFKS